MNLLSAFFSDSIVSKFFNFRVGGGRAKFPSTAPDNLYTYSVQNEVAYSAIRLLARSANDPRLVVQTRTSPKDEWEEQIDHPMTRLLARPDDGTDGAEFLRCVIVGWYTLRLFFAEKIYSTGASGGLPAKLRPLNPLRMKPEFAEDGRTIVAWVYQDGRTNPRFLPEELLIRRAKSWFDPPPLAVAAGSLVLDQSQTSFITAFYDSGGTPPGYIQVKRRLPNGKAEEIQDAWRAKYGRGGEYEGVPAVFDEEGSYTKIGSNLKELDSQPIRNLTESRIAMVFGIHPTILGALVGLEHSTYSNYKEAQEALWDQVLTPMYKELLAWLTWSLLVEFEPEDRIFSGLVRLHWDMSEVSALQDNVVERDKRAVLNFRSGIWTKNESRSLTGQDPHPEGDVFATGNSGASSNVNNPNANPVETPPVEGAGTEDT